MKLVLFDIDGTLIDGGPLGLCSMLQTVKESCGKDAVFEESKMVGRSDIFNLPYLYKCACGKAPSKALLAKLRARYAELLPLEVASGIKAKKCKPAKGAKKFLETLAKSGGVKLALATGNFEECAKIKLKPFGLDKYFETGGFGADSQDRTKLIAAAVRRASVFYDVVFAAGDVYVIGDTHRDITAAKENGFHSAVVTGCSLDDRERILRAAAELETKDFCDIKLWLVWLGLQNDPKGVEKGSYIMPASAIEHVFFSHTGIDEQRLKMCKIKKYSELESGKI